MKGLTLVVLAALSVSPSAPQDSAGTPPRPEGSGAASGEAETGVASWYGRPFHGRAAASGEIYDMETLTAAHPTLPFNTRVRVVNLDNKKSVEVRITDRGPYIEGRVIDLSHAAARALGMIAPGTVPVRLEVLRIPEGIDTADRFAVQVGAFVTRATAEQLRNEMQERYGVAQIVLREGEPVMWRVWVGSEANQADANALAQRIRQRPGGIHAFVVRPES